MAQLKTKGPKHDSQDLITSPIPEPTQDRQHQLRSPMPEGGEP